MQVNRQNCQACGSIEVRNILVREADQPTIVYVRCGKCAELVARYELNDYYHHGKGIESYLRAHGVVAADSGRQWLAEFKRAQQNAQTGYEEALRLLADEQKEV